LKSEVFTFSRLGETSSPERDDFSLKIGACRLSYNSSKSLGGFVILSPRRDLLTWARMSVFTIVPAGKVENKPKQHPETQNKHFFTTIIIIQTSRCETD